MTAKTIQRGSSGLRLTGIYCAAMVLLYVGERMVETSAVRLGLAATALLGIIIAMIGRLRRRSTLGKQAAPVEQRILVCYAIGLLSLLVYAATADFAMEVIRPMFDEAKAADRYEATLGTLWPVLWICAIVPLALLEIAYAPMDLSRTVDLGRIRRSIYSGLIMAMSVCLVFTLNFIFNEYNEKFDLSYFKTTRPSESSRKMVKNLSEPLKAVLFFPGANEVQDRVRSYFDELAGESSKFTVEVADHVLQPALAKELSVTSNGFVVLTRGKNKKEKIEIGTKLRAAKRKLKKLDSEFQTAFLKASRGQKIAYLTTGHEERSNKRRENTPGSSIGELRKLLGTLNFQVKDLGIGQGLAQEIPKDAGMVIIVGPQREFLPAEAKALQTYFAAGGRGFILLDPEAEWDAASLLGPLGLKYNPVHLSNDRYHARVNYNQADRHLLFSVRFSSHDSVTTLSRNSPKLASVFFRSGYLEQIPSTVGLKSNVRFTVHSMPYTYNDVNKNYTFDKDTEKRKVYELAAAVTIKPQSASKAKKGKSDVDEARVVVVSDSDVAADLGFRNVLGNRYLLLDTLRWLGGEEKFAGETTSEEDIRISHTRKEDQIWFYLTIFAMPAIVLGGGLFYTRRRRRKQ